MLRHICKIFVALVLFLPVFVSAQVIINEIYYSPLSKQWIEIYNNTDSGIDLSQYKILDSGAAVNGHGVSLCTGELQPHSYGVIAKIPDDFLGSSFVICKSSLGIKTTADDTVILRTDSSDVDTIQVTLNSAIGGDSMQRQDNSWVAGTPTPGAANSGASIPNSSDDSGITTSGSSSSSSAHYSSTPVSSAKPSATKLDISIGRDRVVAAGSPIEFKVDGIIASKSSMFHWNFGDGSEAGGAAISHTYEYPGDYVAVLTANVSGGEAVARANVKVFEPELFITTADNKRIELQNKSRNEMSLFGRAIMSNGEVFVFPKDTVVKPGAKISFSSRVTGFTGANISNTEFLVLGENRNGLEIMEMVEENRSEKISQIQSQIASLQQKVAQIYTYPTPSLAASPPGGEVVEEIQEPEEVLYTEMAEMQTAAVRDGWLSVIKRFFLRTM